MKKINLFTLILIVTLTLTACTSPTINNGDPGSEAVLVISGDGISKSYTRADVEALTATQSTFNVVTYQGVLVTALLENAGFDLATIKGLKGVASDGYTVNYTTNEVFADGVIVAYATADGELTADDGAFRMVLPGAEGRLNMRMLVELQVSQ